MADTDVWGLGGPIAAPAAGDRVPIATGPGAGGYSLRGSFMWKGSDGIFRADGNTLIPITKAHNFHTADIGIGTPGSEGLQIYTGAGDVIRFGHMASGVFTEDARISGNGNVGIGVSPSVKLHVKSTGEIARLETTTARGSGACYQSYQDPSGQKGFTGYGGGEETLYIFNVLNSPITFATNNTPRWSINSSSLFPVADNNYSLGGGSFRVSVVYAATGTINTSDEREKTWREMLGIGVALFAPNLYEAELRAGLRIIEEIGVYQWNDSIALKGPDEARPHIGPRAQRVWAICADEGLCPALVQREPGGDWLPPAGSIPPAFLCFDEWGEETAPVLAWWRPSSILDTDGQPIMVPCEEGEEGTEQRPTGETYVKRPAGNRFSLRLDQLHSLIIAALNARRMAQAEAIAAMEARIAALEAA